MDGRNIGKALSSAMRRMQQAGGSGAGGSAGGSSAGGGGRDLRGALLGTGGLFLLGGGAILINSALFNGASWMRIGSSSKC
jgi:hypothetical protein